jgi:hypothetical protein
LLFYIKDSDTPAALLDVPPSQFSGALKKGMRDLEEEYDPYILLKVNKRRKGRGERNNNNDFLDLYR